MRILLTGRHGFDYNRVQVLLRGLEQVHADQFEVYIFGQRDTAAAKGLAARAVRFDVVYIPPFRQRDAAFVKRHVGDVPVILDPLIGSTITRVVDYGSWWRKPYTRWLDRRLFLASDYILFDTEAHRDWSIRELGLPPNRCRTLYIGADTDLLNPGLSSTRVERPIIVGFYGSLVPLQGVDKIIEAAHLLRDHTTIRFEIVGDIAKVPDMARLREAKPSKQVKYYEYLPFAELVERMKTWDICLGCFGESLKADIVIPNKVYHYAALGKAIISRDTRGMAERFEAGRDFVGVPPDTAALVRAIEDLAGYSARRRALGLAARSVMMRGLTAKHIAQDFLRIARDVVG